MEDWQFSLIKTLEQNGRHADSLYYISEVLEKYSKEFTDTLIRSCTTSSVPAMDISIAKNLIVAYKTLNRALLQAQQGYKMAEMQAFAEELKRHE